MTTRSIFGFGLSALMLAGATVGCTATHGLLATAGTSQAENVKQASRYADKARKMLAKGKADRAVGPAEQAVAFAPRDAGDRALLGEAYLKAGRFLSASQALGDALSLDPANAEVALNLSLAQIATGDWDAARRTLDRNKDVIAPADRGLALALAGDPKTAVAILSEVARGASANATARQNLALALALSGQWAEARAIAAIDVAPDQLDQRIAQWAQFATPAKASDQVAALLGVTPVADPGQPVHLALKDSDTQVAANMPAADEDMPATDEVAASDIPDSDAPAPAPIAAPQPAMQLAGDGGPAISFAPRSEIAQPLPANYAKAQPVRARPAVQHDVPVAPAPATLSDGNYYVQLGAYDNAAVAHDAWARIKRRNAQIASLTPLGMEAQVQGHSFYRLSIGGFGRADATRLCRTVKSVGGRCFVRPDAGYKMAAWVKKDSELASR